MARFSVILSYKGKTVPIPDISHVTTKENLLSLARHHLEVGDDVLLKLLYKGTIIGQDRAAETQDKPAFPLDAKIPSTGAKVIVMGTEARGVEILNSGRSDPLMRGFDDTPKRTVPVSYWGPSHGKQHPQYKFCRLQECTDASFGTRPGATTPHAFEARRLLERLSTDPGIIAVLKSRELVVGTLGEMDPIDDRLMQKKQQEGACLLGYNTNHGMRIDVKLRTDDLSAFRPYPELAATLVHELSHNWVGEHNILFWTNFGQMRVEYLWKHACLLLGGEFVNGKRTAELAGVTSMICSSVGRKGHMSHMHLLDASQVMENICKSVFEELAHEMAQHRIPVQMVIPAVLEFSKELMEETKDDTSSGGRRLGRASVEHTVAGESSAKELAVAAAEKRARDANKRAEEE